MPELTPNRALPRVRTPWWFRLIRALLNLALLLLLGIQVFALVIISSDKHLQLPAFAQQALEENLQKQGLQVHFSSLEVTPTGTLLVRDPQIFLNGTPDPVVEAEYVIVEPDWIALLWSHQLTLSQFRFGNATLYCPPENSPTGEREPVLSEFGAGLTSQGNHWWRLDFLRGHLLNLQFSAAGDFVLPMNILEALTATPSKPGALSLAMEYRQWSRALLNLKPQFANFDNPLLKVEVAGKNATTNVLQIYAQASSARLPIPGLELNDSWIHFSASWDGKVIYALAPAQAHAHAVHYNPNASGTEKQDLAATGPVWACLQLTDGKDGIFSGRPLRASLFALSSKIGDVSLDSLETDVNLHTWPSLPFTISVLQNEDWLNASGQTEFAVQDNELKWEGGNISARASLQLKSVLNVSNVQLPQRLAGLSLDGPLKIAGHAVIPPSGGWTLKNVVLHTDGVHLEKINLDSVQAKVDLSRDEAGGMQIHISEAELNNRTWQANFDYTQNLRTNDFCLLMHGDVDPLAVEPYLPEWWHELWTNITPGGQWPQGDFMYQGNWKQHEAYDTVNVFAQIANARVRGVRTDDIRVRVEQRPEILSVFDIVGHASGGGELHGAMYWTMKPPYEHVYEERMVFDSTLPLASLGEIGGKEAADVVHPLESTTAPTVHFDQRTGGLANPQPHVTATHVHAEFSAPLHAYHVPLDRAVADVTAYPNYTDIPHFEIGLAGGQAQGNATITTLASGEDELRFSVLLQNARHTDFLAALGDFRVSEERPVAATVTSTAENATAAKTSPPSMLGDANKPGLLDLSLGGRFILGQPDSFAAAGQARVRNAQLGQLQLLGALSRTLSDIKVPLGEFSLNAATSNIQIAHQYMRMPNLVVTGPSARIVAAGVYNIAENDLNFNALIFPIGEWDSFLLKQIASIMNPFSNTVTLKLHGKVEKPTWNVSMNPLRLFEDRTVEGPAIPGFPTTANGGPDLPELPPALPLPELPAEKK